MDDNIPFPDERTLKIFCGRAKPEDDATTVSAKIMVMPIRTRGSCRGLSMSTAACFSVTFCGYCSKK